jgi:hypothetical protein
MADQDVTLRLNIEAGGDADGALKISGNAGKEVVREGICSRVEGDKRAERTESGAIARWLGSVVQ